MCHLTSFFSISSFPFKRAGSRDGHRNTILTPHIQPDSEVKKIAKYAFVSINCSLETVIPSQCLVFTQGIHFFKPFH